MNLEEKANKYSKQIVPTSLEKETRFTKACFKDGYKECISDIKDFIKANPKITADQITEYLNSL